MPWCEECAKYWAPSAMKPDGSCPKCGNVVEPPKVASTHTSKNLDLKALAGSTTVDDEDEGAPWHFKLLMVALVGYLAWRIIDLFV